MGHRHANGKSHPLAMELVEGLRPLYFSLFKHSIRGRVGIAPRLPARGSAA